MEVNLGNIILFLFKQDFFYFFVLVSTSRKRIFDCTSILVHQYSEKHYVGLRFPTFSIDTIGSICYNESSCCSFKRRPIVILESVPDENFDLRIPKDFREYLKEYLESLITQHQLFTDHKSVSGEYVVSYVGRTYLIVEAHLSNENIGEETELVYDGTMIVNIIRGFKVIFGEVLDKNEKVIVDI